MGRRQSREKPRASAPLSGVVVRQGWGCLGGGASTPCMPGSRALGLRRERRTPSRGCGNCPAPCVAALGAQRMEAGRPLQCGSHLIQGRAPLGAFVLGVFTATAVEGRPGRTAGRFVRLGVCGSPGGRPWLSPACSAPSRDWFPGRVGRCSRGPERALCLRRPWARVWHGQSRGDWRVTVPVPSRQRPACRAVYVAVFTSGPNRSNL